MPARHTRPKRRHVPTTGLTPDQIVSAPVEYRSFEVRTVGPAVVLVAERDAPLRMDVLASTHAEQEALREFVHRDPRVAELLGTYFDHGEDDLFVREDAHAKRLKKGQPSSLRVIE
jgi:hypothetical protein